MLVLRRLVTPLLAVALSLGAAGIAAAHAVHWSHLQRVTVTVANGSLAPPYGRPHTKTFRTSAQLREVTGALNGEGIAQRRSRHATGGCTGGYNLTITIVPAHGAHVSLQAYRCGDRTSGTIAGNVPAFLRAIHLRVP
ncbi:MAG: hypothetical protein ACRDMJ_16225 [Solirubrobacteraceae bacterium]